jgi:hypothetical protein
MHMKSRSFATLIIAVLALAVALPLVPVRGSSGNIHINSLTSPSPHITIKLGGSLNLYFGGVVWSGGQVNLYLSSDGYASISTDDTSYGPTFQVNNIQNMTGSTTISGYTVGLNWINGTVPTSLGVPGGNYYVKAFDGSTSAVAVTDTYFTIEATFEVVPSWGPGQAAIVLKGYGLPANGHANFSYNTGSGWTTIVTLKPADSDGNVQHPYTAPDLLMALPAGLQTNTTSTIQFRMIVDETGQTETANFLEYWRGLKQVKGATGVLAAFPNLYGNMTDLSTYEVNVTVLGNLIIAGYYFHPGTLTFLWDGGTAIGTATANATHGFFNATLPVPITSIGAHNVTIDDGKCIFVVFVNVIPTLILNPTSGPVGTLVTATGYGFPASDGTKYNVTLSWDYVDACSPASVVLGYILTNTHGQFTTTFTVPHTVGGAHTVTATANDTASTSATATFTVLVTLAVTPSSPTNTGTLVTVSGTGLDWYPFYDLCIDYTKDFIASGGEVDDGYTYGLPVYFAGDCVGDLSFEFVVGAGFTPGVHVIALYKYETPYELPTLEKYILFTVVGESEVMTKLDEISDMLTGLDSFVRSDSSQIHSLLTSIQSAITAAKTAIQTDISGLGSQLTSIATSASTAASRADAAATSATNAATYAQAAETAAEGAQSATSGISMAVYGAVILALVAALASIFAVITLQRKVA